MECSFFRRETVEKEVVLGIDEEGYREILDFEVNPSEGVESWLEMIKRLYDRGVSRWSYWT